MGSGITWIGQYRRNGRYGHGVQVRIWGALIKISSAGRKPGAAHEGGGPMTSLAQKNASA
jgi:hypothetical protein